MSEKTIHTEEEAREWFLRYSVGSVTVVNSLGETKDCDTYPDAVEWLQT